jgi:hypothetical protein
MMLFRNIGTTRGVGIRDRVGTCGKPLRGKKVTGVEGKDDAELQLELGESCLSRRLPSCFREAEI